MVRSPCRTTMQVTCFRRMPAVLCLAVKTIHMTRGVIPYSALNVIVKMCCERNAQERNISKSANCSKYTGVDESVCTFTQILIQQNIFNNTTNENGIWDHSS